MKKQKGNAIISLIGILIILAMAIGAGTGWVLNIIAIAHANFNDITGLLVLRIIGVFVAPLGAILGYC